MAIAEIHNYIKDPRDYNRGLSLYQKYGRDTYLKELFARGANVYTRKKLLEELKSLAVMEEVVPVTVEVPGPKKGYPERQERILEPELQHPDISKLPKHLQELAVKKGKLFHEASKLHWQMNELRTDQARLQNIEKLMGNLKEVDMIWEQINTFLEKEQVNDDDLANKRKLPLKDFIDRYRNLPTYISKARKLLAKLKDPEQKRKKEKALAKYEAELEEMNNTIENGYIII